VAPVKAEKGIPEDNATVAMSEFYDGIMISLFCLGREQILATRTNIGASNTFYSQKTFAEMFEDGVKVDGNEHLVASENTFVNMVLQHPEHKTVGVLQSPRIIVTHRGTIQADGTVVVTVARNDLIQQFSEKAMNILIGDCVRRSGHMFQGFVYQDPVSSRRWRVRSQAYTKVRSLRGAEASPFTRFLRLREEGKMKDYLRYFPEESNLMWAMEQAWRARTQKLYEYYVEKNKAKKIGLTDIPHPFRQHVYAIHGKYLEQMAAAKENGTYVAPIVKDSVIAYINGLSMEDKLRFMNGECDKKSFLETIPTGKPQGHIRR
jgi:hypothetical protein